MSKERFGLNKPRLWIVSELFYPEQSSTAAILTEIAESMSLTRDVHVLCGPKGYESVNYTKSDDHLPGITIHRINIFNFNKNIFWKRIVRMIGISMALCLCFLFKARKRENVLIVTNPALLLIFFTWIARLKKSNLSILVHDIFPENSIAAGIISKKTSILYRFLLKIFNRSYRRANRLIAIGSDMAEVLEKKIRKKNKKTVEIIVIPNWSDIDKIKPIPKDDTHLKRWGVENKFVFLFAGNMGRVQGLNKLSEIIDKVKNPLVYFIFLGEGAYKERLKELTKDNLNVMIGESFSRDQQEVFLNSCQVALISLSPNMYGLGVPSKFYNILAAAKPILYIGESGSEIDRYILKYNIGWSFSDYDDELVQFFNNVDERYFDIAFQLGVNARICAENIFSKKKIMKQFDTVL
ncbi:MAG: glycosyltransferase family 4 protein [Bacteroidales bacterium]|jgi:glycosyltransferase involved in cell wall biosynthesis|nr:glycosyltransferase family 4 protein [Bacteroidales bacterium]